MKLMTVVSASNIRIFASPKLQNFIGTPNLFQLQSIRYEVESFFFFFFLLVLCKCTFLYTLKRVETGYWCGRIFATRSLVFRRFYWPIGSQNINGESLFDCKCLVN